MKLPKLTIERIIIVVLTVLALIGWTRPYQPTPENLNTTANEIVQENPNLAVILYTVADALDAGFIHSRAMVTATFQERFILNSIEIPAENKADVHT